MQKWVKVRRKVVKSSYHPEHWSGWGEYHIYHQPVCHVWFECGHEKDIYCVESKLPKTSICPKCSYREGEKPSNTACTPTDGGPCENCGSVGKNDYGLCVACSYA